jgi:hypothetical protein
VLGVLTLYGVGVTAENARHIVASLFVDDSPAAMIQKGDAVALEPGRGARSWPCSRIRAGSKARTWAGLDRAKVED